jgi:cytochrome c-type biogenesis protein CcmH
MAPEWTFKKMIFLFRWTNLLPAALAMFFMTGSNPAWGAEPAKPGVFPEELFNSIQREMICLCGCKSILKDCPHVKCDYAIPARKNIREALERGKTRDQIIAQFVSERGEVALAAPKGEGFNVLGYVLPFIAILAAGYAVASITRRWAAKGAGDEGAAETPAAKMAGEPEAADEMAERLKKELEEFDS